MLSTKKLIKYRIISTASNTSIQEIHFLLIPFPAKSQERGSPDGFGVGFSVMTFLNGRLKRITLPDQLLRLVYRKAHSE